MCSAIPRNFVLEIGYLGSFSRKLESLRAANESFRVPQYCRFRAPYPEFGRIQLVDNGGQWRLQLVQREAYQTFQWRIQSAEFLHLGEIVRRFQRHSCAERRHAFPAE